MFIFSENPDPPSIVKLFKCSLCEKKFLDRNNLQLHSKLHMDPTDFECEICHCFFHTKNGLKVHKSNMHRHSKRNREIRLNCEKSKIVSKCKKCPSVFRYVSFGIQIGINNMKDVLWRNNVERC